MKSSHTSGLRTPNDLGPACPTIVHTAADSGPGASWGGGHHFPLDCFCACINEEDV